MSRLRSKSNESGKAVILCPEKGLESRPMLPARREAGPWHRVMMSLSLFRK